MACLLFVVLVLGLVARMAGFRILLFLRYIRDELLVVLGTSSSEVALRSTASRRRTGRKFASGVAG